MGNGGCGQHLGDASTGRDLELSLVTHTVLSLIPSLAHTAEGHPSVAAGPGSHSSRYSWRRGSLPQRGTFRCWCDASLKPNNEEEALCSAHSFG